MGGQGKGAECARREGCERLISLKTEGCGESGDSMPCRAPPRRDVKDAGEDRLAPTSHTSHTSHTSYGPAIRRYWKIHGPGVSMRLRMTLPGIPGSTRGPG